MYRIWLNEAQEIQDRTLVEWMINRVGRFPDPQRAPLTWSGFLADANAMDTDTGGMTGGTQHAERIQVLPATARGHQVNGEWVMNPGCENVAGQAKGVRYWLDQIPGKHESWIKLNFCAEYGQTAGDGGLSEFEEVRHAARRS